MKPSPSLTARIFVTDVGMLPLRGDTRVEQAVNYETDRHDARANRLVSVAAQFYGLVDARRTPFVCDEFLEAVRYEIARMVAAGDLCAGRMGEMLASVGYAEGGKVSVAIVDLWGNEVVL